MVNSFKVFTRVCAVWLLITRLASAGTIVIDDAFEEMSLGKHLELAYDPTGELTIEDVLAGKLQFTPSTKDVPNFGYRKGAESARVFIDDRRAPLQDALRVVFEQGQVDRLEVFDVVDGVIGRRRLAGDQVPRRQWGTEVTRMPTFALKRGGAPGATTAVLHSVGDHSHQFPVRPHRAALNEEGERHGAGA